jgi:hypothetical protein
MFLLARPRTVAALAVCSAIAASAGLHPTSAGAASGKRDQIAALRVSVKWITLYQPRFWVAVATPGACVAQPGGARRCPIAIRAWVGSSLREHRCIAEALLPRRGSRGKPTRTSARCTPVRAVAGES